MTHTRTAYPPPAFERLCYRHSAEQSDPNDSRATRPAVMLVAESECEKCQAEKVK